MEGQTRWQDQREKGMAWQKDEIEEVQCRRQAIHKQDTQSTRKASTKVSWFHHALTKVTSKCK
jgi:hypothetical protein